MMTMRTMVVAAGGTWGAGASWLTHLQRPRGLALTCGLSLRLSRGAEEAAAGLPAVGSNRTLSYARDPAPHSRARRPQALLLLLLLQVEEEAQGTR